MAIETKDVTKQTKKHKKNKNIVSFEEESINKETAIEVLAKIHKSDDIKEESIVEEVKGKKRKSKSKNDSINEQEIDEFVDVVKTENKQDTKKEKKQKKKKNKLKNNSELQSGESVKSSKNKRKTDNAVNEETEPKKQKLSDENGESVEPNENDTETPAKTEESIRAKKRKKHQQLMDEKKKKAQLATQENVLNYLSKWKHARNDWKFEKLKQIWLSDNVFDSSKIPDEFWETAVEYFSGSRGFIRNLIVREALKIIENEDKAEEENLEEEYQSRLKRARDIVQNLQE